MKLYIVENDYCISGIFKTYDEALTFSNNCTTSGTVITVLETEDKEK